MRRQRLPILRHRLNLHPDQILRRPLQHVYDAPARDLLHRRRRPHPLRQELHLHARHLLPPAQHHSLSRPMPVRCYCRCRCRCCAFRQPTTTYIGLPPSYIHAIADNIPSYTGSPTTTVARATKPCQVLGTECADQGPGAFCYITETCSGACVGTGPPPPTATPMPTPTPTPTCPAARPCGAQQDCRRGEQCVDKNGEKCKDWDRNCRGVCTPQK